MSEEASQRLIRELAADLEPVEAFPRLRVLLASTVAMWAALVATVLIVLGPRMDLSLVLSSNSAYGGVALGLLLAGICGSLAAFAAAVPGRESLRLGALAAAVSGVSVAGVLCLRAPSGTAPIEPLADLVCMGYAALLAVPLVSFISYRVVRGWVQEPQRVAVLALFGAVAMGALIVHLICPAGASTHFLTAHLGAAPLGALLGAVPLTFLLKRASE